jgi:pyrroline-5-carboxylate reductase
VTTAASLVPDGTAGELSLQAGLRFDRYYQELKADWMEANPDKKFNVGVQYQIATQAVDLAKQAVLPNDIIRSVGETMTVNQNVSDALSAAQSSAAGASVVATPDSLISIIEGGNP